MLTALLLAAAAPGLPLFANPMTEAALEGFEARPGAWGEYAVVPRVGRRLRVRLSVLGPSLSAGRYWLEGATWTASGPPSAVRILLHGPPARPESVERLLVLVAGQAPMEFPLDAATRSGPPAGPAVKQDKEEVVRVPAGEFRAQVSRAGSARVWRSAAIPLWGLVRATDAHRAVELVAFGRSGAKSVFPPEFDQGKGSESRK